jgi:hypothetical protein
MTDKTIAGHAAYDDQAVWGLGTTPDAALAEAHYEATLWQVSAEEIAAFVARLSTARITPELVSQVKRGNPTSFVKRADGVLDVPGED